MMATVAAVAFLWDTKGGTADGGAPEAIASAIDAGIIELHDYLTRGGHWRLGMELYKRQLAIRRAAENRSGEATTLNNLGYLASSLGQKEEARRYYEQALATFTQIGAVDSVRVVQGNLDALSARGT